MPDQIVLYLITESDSDLNRGLLFKMPYCSFSGIIRQIPYMTVKMQWSVLLIWVLNGLQKRLETIFRRHRIGDLRTVVSLLPTDCWKVLDDSENSKGLKKDTTVFIIMFGLICVLLRVQFCNFVRFKYY